MNKKIIIIIFIILGAVFLVKQNLGKENPIIEQEDTKIETVADTKEAEQDGATIEGLERKLLELEQTLEKLEQMKKKYEK